MNFEYNLDSEDFLNFQLYTASKSNAIKLKRKKNKTIIPILYIVLSIFSYYFDNIFLALLFILLALLWYLFFPGFESKRYQRNLEKYINENYAEILDQKNNVSINDESVTITIGTKKTINKIEEISKVNEIDHYYFITFKSGITLILPKSKINEIEKLKILLQNLIEKNSIPYNFEPKWAWK